MSVRALLNAYAAAYEERWDRHWAMETGMHYPSYYREYPARIARLDGLMERIAVRLEQRAAAGERP